VGRKETNKRKENRKAERTKESTVREVEAVASAKKENGGWYESWEIRFGE